MVEVVGNFEGANPRDDGISQQGGHQFTIRTYSEIELESFRLETKIRNVSNGSQEVDLEILWANESFSELRDCLYWKHENDEDWSPCFGETHSGITRVRLVAPPGEGFLCLHPRYGYDDCESFVNSIKHLQVQKRLAGTTEKGRKIFHLSATDGVLEDSRPAILVAARNHANETSGNFCVEGMLHWLLSSDPLARYALTKFHFHFLPMTNPDGVAEGMARFVSPKGTDLNREPEWLIEHQPQSLPDMSHATFFKILDEIRPCMFMNLHSYLFKHKDEIYGSSEETINKFVRFMPDQIEAGKVWRRTISDQESFPTGYCEKNFASTAFLIEIPWFGRNVRTMRETGAKLLRAMILMNTVTGDRSWGELG